MNKQKGKKRKRTEWNLFRYAKPEIFALIDRDMTMKKEDLTDEDIDTITRASKDRLWFRCGKHSTCNEHVWSNTPNRINMENGSCPFCNPRTAKMCRCDPRLLRHSHPNIFAQIDRELTKKETGMNDDDIDLIGAGTQKKVWFRCTSHSTCNEHVWFGSPYNTTKYSQCCSFCNPNSNKTCICDPDLLSKTFPEIYRQIDRDLTTNKEGLTNFQIDRLLYGSKQYVWFKCAKHTTCKNHIWRAKLNGITSSSRNNPTNKCPYCFGFGRCSKTCVCFSLQTKYPKIAANWDPDNECTASEILSKSGKVFKWICQICDYKWEMSVYSCVRLVRGCPNCTVLAQESVGAEACRLALTSMNESFINEAKIDGLGSLRFDFLCPTRQYPKRSRILIEFDGEQHFRFGGKWHRTVKGFKEYHLRDLIKNRFCGQNGIHLLRISYSIPKDKIANVIRRFFSRIETATGTQSITQYVGKEYDEHYHTEW